MKLPDGWKTKTLGEITIWSSGGTPSKKNSEYWQGNIPWVSASSMHNEEIYKTEFLISREGLAAGSRLAKKGNLLLLVRGSMLWKKIPVCMAMRDVAFNQDVKALKVNGEINSKYLQYWFMSHENFLLHQTVGTGIGAGKLDTDEMKALSVSYPLSSREQQTIIDILSTWDAAIEKTECLIAAKEKHFKWLFNKLLIKPCSNGRWKKVVLGSMIIERNKKSEKHDHYPVFTSSRRGIFLQDEYFSKQVTSKDNTGYKILYKGDFTYRAMSDDGLFVFNRLDDYRNGIISPAYGVFHLKDIDSDFLLYYLNSSIFRREVAKEAQGGTRTALKLSSIKRMKVSLPEIKEQKEIVNTLNTCRSEIYFLRNLLEKYKLQKRGLMQKLLTGQWRVKE